jgi:uncharacterized membrane protein YhaH (DUF805 family)
MLMMRNLASLLFSPSGRIALRWYWLAAFGVTALFLLTLPLVEALAMVLDSRWLAVLAYLPLYWVAFCLMAKRCHDIGRSAWWLLLLLIPVIGILWLVAVLAFRRGNPGRNQYGPDPRTPTPDYLMVQAVS